MLVNSTRLGMLEVTDAEILAFSEGIAGFETVREYCVISHAPHSPFVWLQALSHPELAFVLVDPFVLYPQYTITMEDADAAGFRLQGRDAMCAFLIVTFAKTGMTVNLAGPIVVNPNTRQARQIVLTESQYSCRQLVGTPGSKWSVRQWVNDKRYAIGGRIAMAHDNANALSQDEKAQVIDLLSDLTEPDEAWERLFRTHALKVCAQTRSAAGLPPVDHETECQYCIAENHCDLGEVKSDSTDSDRS